jgi:SAM-dependent methyltransferase
MAIPILKTWRSYFEESPHEGLGSSYERVVLNRKLEDLRQRYSIRTCLEVPVFGFTGLTGINSLGLAKDGVQVTLVDDNDERLGLITGCWDQAGERFAGHCVRGFSPLPFERESFDFSWNFSALWFVTDLRLFLRELTRVTKKAILLCVPNRWGVGYLSQKYISGAELREFLMERHIIPHMITRSMEALGWDLVERDYIDAPPWPDIGMKKEEFFKLLGLRLLVRESTGSERQVLTIMSYYRGEDPEFPLRMLRHAWFERNAPQFVKALWAHHRFLLFEPCKAVRENRLGRGPHDKPFESTSGASRCPAGLCGER